MRVFYFVFVTLSLCAITQAAPPRAYQSHNCSSAWLNFFIYSCGLGAVKQAPSGELQCFCGKANEPIDVFTSTCDLLSPEDYKAYQLAKAGALSEEDRSVLHFAKEMRSPVIYKFLPVELSKEVSPPYLFTFKECTEGFGGGFSAPPQHSSLECRNEKGALERLPVTGACVCLNDKGPRRRISSPDDERCP